MNLEKKVVLITGGASGIGLACAKEFLANGIKGIGLVDINEEEGNEVQQQLNRTFTTQKTLFIKADVSNKESLRDAFQKIVDAFGNLDIVLNNAGILNEIVAVDCYKVNLIGATNCAELAMNEFLPKYKIEDGIIINTSSTVALDARNWHTIPIYTTSKMAILGLTITLGHEFHYSRTGVKVMAICPGKTTTATSKQCLPTRIIHLDALKNAAGSAINQKASVLAKHVIEILKYGRNGSIWKIEAGKKEEITTF